MSYDRSITNMISTDVQVVIYRCSRLSSFYNLFINNWEKLQQLFIKLNLPFNISMDIYRDKIDRINSACQTLETLIAELRISKDDELSEQYTVFLRKMISGKNWGEVYPIDSTSFNIISSSLLNKNENEILGLPNHSDILNRLQSFTSQENNFYIMIDKIRSAILIFNKIKNIKANIVIIGANGSGKSTFSRELADQLGNNIVIISAQHLLLYEGSGGLSKNKAELSAVKSFQKNKKFGNDSQLLNLFS